MWISAYAEIDMRERAGEEVICMQTADCGLQG